MQAAQNTNGRLHENALKYNAYQAKGVAAMRKTLIVYYSRKGENYYDGSIRNLEKGNTERVAEMIAGLTGGDLFEVETAKPYAEGYRDCVEQAKIEWQENIRPALKKTLESLEAYDTVFVGYPNWFSTMPMAMFTFLEKYHWEGKRILPFCTSEGSGLGRSEQDIKKICVGATVQPGLAVHGASAANAQAQVEAWVKQSL